MVEVLAVGTRCHAWCSDRITAGSVGLMAHFKLSADFEGMDVTACWRAGDRYVDTPLGGLDVVVQVPPELLLVPDALLSVGVRGKRPGRTIPTVVAPVGHVLPSTADHH